MESDAPEELDIRQVSPQVFRKAMTLLHAGAVSRRQDLVATYVVTSSVRDDNYYVRAGRVQDGPPAWITCTCPSGLHRGGSRLACAHQTAVFLLETNEWSAALPKE
jgi:hypothetical protein